MRRIESMAERAKNVEQAEADGAIETRERENPEACPHCLGIYRRCYRWLIPSAAFHAMGGEEDTPDPRWFCYCGYAEVPSTDHDSWAKGR